MIINGKYAYSIYRNRLYITTSNKRMRKYEYHIMHTGGSSFLIRKINIKTNESTIFEADTTYDAISIITNNNRSKKNSIEITYILNIYLRLLYEGSIKKIF